MKMYIIEKRINNTTVFCKVPYNCLSLKQREHIVIKKNNKKNNKKK